LPITKEQVSELNKKGLFEESIDTIIRNRFPAGLRVSKENSVLCGKRSAKKSDAFEFGFVVALHALSFVSQWPAQENIRKQLEEWNMQGCSFEISTPDEVATFLNEFTKEFGEKWGADLEESLYLGSCFLFGVAHYLEKHNWGDWGLKIKLQCVKLNLPEQVIEKFTDKLSRDDIMLLKAQLAMALCK